MSNNLVTTEWLAEHLGDDTLVVLDASWSLPGGPDTRAAFRERHIPGAGFFDIEEVCDRQDPRPHMLPSEAVFAEKVGALGISNDHFIVVYDTGGVHPAARVWWMFRAFGHDQAVVLDGGLQKWTAEGRPLEAGAANPAPKTFQANFNPGMVVGRAAVLENIQTGACTVLDARGPGRFSGSQAEPRPGLRSGHIPGARNLYYGALLNADGSYKSDRELKGLMEAKGLSQECEIITSCGSGVTAAILAFALDRLGYKNVKIYDGSWAEWGLDPELPVETGLDER